MPDMQQTIDAVLTKVVSGDPRVPGVVAVVTDRERDIYVRAEGVRSLDGNVAMTPDTVCAIFSTTKAIVGTVCLQLVEEGKLDLDAPAKRYAPAIGELQVIDGFDHDGSPHAPPPHRGVRL